MGKPGCFVLDSDVFIQANNVYYSMSVCPGFWRALVRHCDAQNLCSIDRVRRELIALRDDVCEWVKNQTPETFFKKTEDQSVVKHFRDIASYINSHSTYVQAEKARFLSGADPWLIAYAKVSGKCIVTLEAAAPTGTKPKIPDVAKQFNVSTCTTFHMLDTLGVEFVLKKVTNI